MQKKYEAFDGKIFNSEHDCEQYELRLAWIRKGFEEYAGDCTYAFRFLVNQCNVSPSFAFFFGATINKAADQGFSSWLAEYSEDLIALGLRLRTANEYFNELNLGDRNKVISEARHISKYVDPKIDWEIGIYKFLSEWIQDPENPFLSAAMQHLLSESEGFGEYVKELLDVGLSESQSQAKAEEG